MLPVRLALDKQKPDARDATVQAYADKGKWGSALAVVDQQSKKGATQRLAVNKSLIQLVSGNYQVTIEGLQTMNQLVHMKDDPIVDPEILEAISNSMPCAMVAEGAPILSKMWERATNIMPKNSKVMNSAWFSAGEHADFVSGRKLAMKASKASEDKHRNRLRAIVSCYLDGEFNKDSQVGELSRSMGLALLKQSFDAIPQVNKSSTTTRPNNKQGKFPIVNDLHSPALQNASDIQLLLLLYSKLDMDEQALAILESDSAGLRSDIGYGSWNLALGKLKLLKKLHRAEESWKFCYQLLREAGKIELEAAEKPLYNYGKSGDDLEIWRAAAKNIYELKDVSLLAKFQELLDNPKFTKRNRFLATVDLSLMIEKDMSIFTDFKTLPFDALQVYLDHYLGTEVAYQDLMDIAKQLTDERRVKLLKKVQEMVPERDTVSSENEVDFRRWMDIQINELKLRYTLEISLEDNNRDVDKLEKFVASAMSLYNISLEHEEKLAITERRTGNEAAILAASALIHLHEFGGYWSLSHATLILEKLVEHSVDHYGALVFLVRLYVLQGCFDLANKHYSKLNIKNIQTFSETWIILERATSVFPYKNKKPNMDLHTILKRTAEYALQKGNGMEQIIETYENIQNWSGLANVYEYYNLCKVSSPRVHVLAELSRFYYRQQIGDCFGHDTVIDHMITIKKPNKDNTHPDLTSAAGFPNYEAIGCDSLASYLNGGPKPDETWIEIEDLMFSWRRLTRLDSWFNGSAKSHGEAASYYVNFSARIKKELLDNIQTNGLTTVELVVAWLLTAMTAVYELTHALGLSSDVLINIEAGSEAGTWEISQLAEFERTWKVFTLTIAEVMKSMYRGSDMIKKEGVKAFCKDQWEYFHCYYKATELLLILPNFIFSRIVAAKEMRRLHDKTDFPLEEFDAFNVAGLETFLRNFLFAAQLVIQNYNDGARSALDFLRDPDNLDQIVDNLYGENEWSVKSDELGNMMGMTYEDDWVERKTLDMIQGWTDGLQGMAHETPLHWRQKKWPAIIAKYLPKLDSNK